MTCTDHIEERCALFRRTSEMCFVQHKSLFFNIICRLFLSLVLFVLKYDITCYLCNYLHVAVFISILDLYISNSIFYTKCSLYQVNYQKFK